MRRESRYHLVCWHGDRVTSLSEAMPLDSALALFSECVARGAYTPNDPARLTVVSLEDRPDMAYPTAA